MNNFGEEFKNLIMNNSFSDLFVEEKYVIDNKVFSVLRFNPNKIIVDHCLKIAEEKAKYTMVYNQNLEERTDEEKLVNAFRGILAETLVHIFFLNYLNISFDKIKRFDLERSSFVYSPLEYDINILTKSGEKRVECRSSSSWTSSIKNACKNKPIIGQYVNSTKSKEAVSDLYSCVLFQYESYFYKKNKIYNMSKEEKDSLKLNTIEDILSGNLMVYLPSGTDVEQMTGPDSRRDNYGQKNTEYNLVDIVKAGDINSYIKKIKKKIEEEP